MKYIASALSMLGVVQGFLATTQQQKFVPKAILDEEVDFDAPIDRAMDVGNVVRSSSNKVSVGPFDIEVPDFLAKAFNKADNNVDIDHLAMDEECYLGKDGDLEDCADFDP